MAAALAGAGTGAWFGLLVGILLGVFAVSAWWRVILVAVIAVSRGVPCSVRSRTR